MKYLIVLLTIVLICGFLPQIIDGEVKHSLEESDDSSFLPISRRNYGNAADPSHTYYSTYNGYPSYDSSSSGTLPDQFNPMEYPHYGVSDSKKKRIYEYPTPTYYFDTPGSYRPPPDCQDQMMHTILGDVLQSGGIGAPGLLKSVVAAVTAGLLAKIPIILAIKALIVKLILVPFGLFILALPIILPIMLLFTPLWTKIKETFFGITTPSPTVMVMMPTNETKPRSMDTDTTNFGRDMFVTLVKSDKCFEKLSCLLGLRDAKSPIIEPVSWLLKFLQSFRYTQNNIETKKLLKRYREAYLRGATEGSNRLNTTNDSNKQAVCSDEKYPCDTPNLYSKPEFKRFSRYL